MLRSTVNFYCQSKSTYKVDLKGIMVVKIDSIYGGTRVARSPVFYGRSRISDPFSGLPGKAAGENKSPVFC